MRCYRKILRISHKDHVANEEVCAKIQQATGPHEDLLTIVKSLKSLVHRSGQNHPARHGERGKKKRQTEKWGWKTTSKKGQAWSSQSPRQQWKTEKMEETVCKSSAVPKRPPRLRYRWRRIRDLFLVLILVMTLSVPRMDSLPSCPCIPMNAEILSLLLRSLSVSPTGSTALGIERLRARFVIPPPVTILIPRVYWLFCLIPKQRWATAPLKVDFFLILSIPVSLLFLVTFSSIFTH